MQFNYIFSKKTVPFKSRLDHKLARINKELIKLKYLKLTLKSNGHQLQKFFIFSNEKQIEYQKSLSSRNEHCLSNFKTKDDLYLNKEDTISTKANTID